MDSANIDGKEAKFRSFFDRFSKDLNKQINLGTKATDPKLVHYQNSVIQGADKQNALNARQDVLLQKLAEYGKDLYKLLNPQISLEEKFLKLYSKLESKLKTQDKINNWIISKHPKVPTTKCAIRNLSQNETLPVHIRNCIHHPQHGRFNNKQIVKSIEILDLIGF